MKRSDARRLMRECNALRGEPTILVADSSTNAHSAEEIDQARRAQAPRRGISSGA